MDQFVNIIHQFVFWGVSVLFIFQAFVLFVRRKNNKARLTLAILDLVWGLTYLQSLTIMLLPNLHPEYSIFREEVLVIGNFFISFMIFFPLQVFVPGWLNTKRAFVLISPILLLTIFYYGVMFLLGERPENLYSYVDLWNLLGHFNVWFRFIILISNFTSIVLILKWMSKYEKKYIEWKNENYADQEYVEVSWMRLYNYMIVGISLFYLAVLMIGGRVTAILHAVFVICSFSYLFCKVLFFENLFPEKFFVKKVDVPDVGNMLDQGDMKAVDNIDTKEEKDSSESAFEQNLPDYVQKVEQWMVVEKPYLYADFKLVDVSRVLPLNRSYLSRVFNEGFGSTFSDVVRVYRVEYSLRLLGEEPTMSLYDVAMRCGFSSDLTYIRAFKQVKGMTPRQYRSR